MTSQGIAARRETPLQLEAARARFVAAPHRPWRAQPLDEPAESSANPDVSVMQRGRPLPRQQHRRCDRRGGVLIERDDGNRLRT